VRNIWRKNPKGEWERPCRHCGGGGKETLQWSSGCLCMDHWTEIEHPWNKKGSVIGEKLMRSDKCGLVWRYYYEISDDSLDVPSPELIGLCIPPIE
jgi:hypothetical protein